MSSLSDRGSSPRRRAEQHRSGPNWILIGAFAFTSVLWVGLLWWFA